MIVKGPDGRQLDIPDKYVREFMRVKALLTDIMQTHDSLYAQHCWKKACKEVKRMERIMGKPHVDPIEHARRMSATIPTLFEALVRHGIVPKDKLS